MPTIFHDEAIEIAVAAHESSVEKHGNEQNDLVRDALFVLSHDSIRVHRAIGTLVDAGWSGPGGALLRTLMDISVSAIAVARSANPRMAAFRYLYNGFRRGSRDQRLPAPDRRKMFDQIRARMEQLPKPLRAEAVNIVKERDRPYWFAPEWASPTAVMDAFARDDLKWTYLQTSAAAHGAFFGMRLFRDTPDVMSINPDPIGPRAYSLDMASSRWVVEIVGIRNAMENLGMEAHIAAFVDRLHDAVTTFPGRGSF